jgi:hypothetical protein
MLEELRGSPCCDGDLTLLHLRPSRERELRG